MFCFELVRGETYCIDLQRPIDITLPVTSKRSANAFYLPNASFMPFRIGGFVGSIEEGGQVQCEIVTLAPHGNGTHTECIGHIAGTGYTIRDCMRSTYSMAYVATVELSHERGGLTITKRALQGVIPDGLMTSVPTLVIRTLPNGLEKMQKVWSGNNPPFVDPDAMQWIVDQGITHLVVDLPSVDPEEDGGALLAHHIFWQWPEQPRVHCTITELVYIPADVADGLYGIGFGIAPFDSDAAPSTISLFRATPVTMP